MTATATTTVTDWRSRALCAGKATREWDPWFPVGSGHAAQAEAKPAIALCRRCPVAARCLREAADTGSLYGVWGGLLRSPESLRNERRRVNRAPIAQEVGVEVSVR